MVAERLFSLKNVLPFLDFTWLYMSESHMEYGAMKLIKPTNIWEYAAILSAIGYRNYIQELSSASNVALVSYEEIVGNAFQVATRLFRDTNLPTDIVAEQIQQCIECDSQADSPFSRDNLRQYDHFKSYWPTNEERVIQIARMLQLPDNFFDMEFEFHPEKYREEVFNCDSE
jgi:hypothetical protein